MLMCSWSGILKLGFVYLIRHYFVSQHLVKTVSEQYGIIKCHGSIEHNCATLSHPQHTQSQARPQRVLAGYDLICYNP
jgi:hypothetical protein